MDSGDLGRPVRELLSSSGEDMGQGHRGWREMHRAERCPGWWVGYAVCDGERGVDGDS